MVYKLTQAEFDAIPDKNSDPPPLNSRMVRYIADNGQKYVIIMKNCGGFNLERAIITDG